MPGLFGLITSMPQEQAELELQRMEAAFQHEDFYSSGTRVDTSLGLYVGWSAHKNSSSDGMPALVDHGMVSLFFSGEDFSGPPPTRNERELTQGLLYLCDAYQKDPAFPRGLNGQFQGLLADRRHATVLLFNDRYGMRRLYYYRTKDAFYFACEAKAILAVCPDLRTINPTSLGEFIACSCVLENRSLFKNIKLLPPASAWVFRNRSLERERTYFQVREWEDQLPLDSEEYYRELRNSLCSQLPRYFAGKQKVAMTLTGGLDTRVIMAWRNPAPGSLACYTFGGMFHQNQDVQLAKRIAGMYRQPHSVITVENEFLSRFPDFAERTVQLTEGCTDISRSPDLYVSSQAREIAPVKVVGTYGSEILRHAVMFKPALPCDDLFQPEVANSARQAGATYTRLRSEHPVTFAAFRQAPWHHQGVLALEQSQLTVRSPFLDNDIVRTLFRAPQPASGPTQDVRLRLINERCPALYDLRTDMSFPGSARPLHAAAWKKYLEFTHKAEYAYDYGMPQWLARTDHLLSPLRLERLFLGRHKFCHFRTWYRSPLSEYVRQMLLDSRTLTRPYLKRNGVEHVVRHHLGGDRNYTREIHKLLTLEIFHRLFIDS